MMHYYREADEQLVRMTLHNLYRECKGFGTRSSMTRDQITAFRLEEFMNRRYEFRWNTVLGELEFRQRDSIHFHFRPADQRVRSSIGQNALKEGISVWDRDVARYLNSDAIPLYNPIEEYLNSTGHWDGKDPYPRIGRPRPLQQSVLAGTLLPLVSQHDGALAKHRPSAWKQHVSPTGRSPRLS